MICSLYGVIEEVLDDSRRYTLNRFNYRHGVNNEYELEVCQCIRTLLIFGKETVGVRYPQRLFPYMTVIYKTATKTLRCPF